MDPKKNLLANPKQAKKLIRELPPADLDNVTGGDGDGGFGDGGFGDGGGVGDGGQVANAAQCMNGCGGRCGGCNTTNA